MMRKLTERLMLTTMLLIPTGAANALPGGEVMADTSDAPVGKVTHTSDGTKLEFNDFSLKIGLVIQNLNRYTDFDEVSGRDVEDKISSEISLLRLKLSGDAYGKDISYYFQNDFVSGSQGDGSRGSDLKDAWLQFNLDEAANLRTGQYKVPFSRQELNSDEKLQLIARGNANDFFAPKRNQGLLLHGKFDGSSGYGLGLFNGQSDGEGENLPGVDNRVMGSGNVWMNMGEYGDRTMEGDFRSSKDFAATMGAAVLFGQGSTEVGEGESDYDKTDVNVDAGIKCSGFTGQAEFYYRNVSLDDVESDDDSGDDFGFYVQGGYQIVENEIELVGQFNMITPDDDFIGGTGFENIPFEKRLLPSGVSGAVDDVEQYSIVLNYYIDKHALKIQSGVTWTVTNFEGSGADDITDTFYQIKVAGYM